MIFLCVVSALLSAVQLRSDGADIESVRASSNSSGARMRKICNMQLSSSIDREVSNR